MAINKFMWDEDIALFRRMKGNYQSEHEREFFETLKYREENVLSVCFDWLILEPENEDRLYLIRCEYSEYLLGKEGNFEEQHYMNLAETLSANLKDLGLLDRDITLFQWLRERDYKGIRYDRNLDDL